MSQNMASRTDKEMCFKQTPYALDMQHGLEVFSRSKPP